jgi:hypothetical protein
MGGEMDFILFVLRYSDNEFLRFVELQYETAAIKRFV